jgi:hypothetical protein
MTGKKSLYIFNRYASLFSNSFGLLLVETTDVEPMDKEAALYSVLPLKNREHPSCVNEQQWLCSSKTLLQI